MDDYINMKTFEMVVKGKTTMPLPEPVDGITRKSELKLLGVTVNEDPCNWDVQFLFNNKDLYILYYIIIIIILYII